MTEQNVSRSENVLQVRGNVEVINRYGLAVNEVKELAHLFMRENFPVLRAEAIAAAQANVQQFLHEFDEKIAQKLEHIDLTKLRNPDIQSSINDAVLEAAKKGTRGNTDILADLVIERLNTGTTDYVSLVASEAIKVVPRLTPAQIGFLTLVVFLRNTKVTSAKSLTDTVPLAEAALEMSRHSFGLSQSQKSHLQFVGCASFLQILGGSAYSTWKAEYDFLKDVPEGELKKTIEQDFPVLHQLAKAFDDNQLAHISLTSVGQMIGLANLSKRVPGLQYANWLN